MVTATTYVFLAAMEKFNPSRLSTIFAVCFILHLIRRCYETFFVQKLSTNSMPFVHFLAGTGYYVAVPFSALIEIHDLFEFHGGTRTFAFGDEGLFLTLIGGALFLIGNAIQFQSHSILAKLRESSSSRRFAIPQGGLFDRISCPHYLAEILIYISFLFVTQFQIINLWLILGFVVATLVHGSKQTHEWYLKKFDDYPRSRSALVPYVY
jgi:3-oxo-5-alpha-steroid 4-dehydrogenase 3